MRYLTLPCAVLLSSFAVAEAAPPGEVDKLYDIATAPSAERIQNDIQALVDFGTRHTLSETESDTRGIGAARRWIYDEFQAISAECGGCLEVIYVSDTISGERRIPEPTQVVSVLAIQRGTTDPNRYVMMSGDIDSRVSDPLNGTDDSPGANDNASGMAGAIEAARVLSKYQFPGSIIYAGLSGEEQGLFGGRIVAAHALEQGWEIKGVLNNDMISNIRGIDGVINNTTARVFSEGVRYVETPEEARLRRFEGGEVDSPSRNLARYVKAMTDQYMVNLDMMMVYRLDRFRRGGHHRPFNEVGIPGVRIMETHEHYDRQHQDLRMEVGVDLELSLYGRNQGLTVSQILEGLTYEVLSAEEDLALFKTDDFDPDFVFKHVGLRDGGDTFIEEMITRVNGREYALHEVARLQTSYINYGDTMDGVDAEFAAKLTGVNAIVLAGMAGAPPFPANVEISGAVQPSSTLTWDTPENSDNLAGYRVHWRLTTAPEWTHSRFVGKVNEWTFDNLVIDNYFFGVSAVAEDGSETPVVFPGPAGRF